jgi:hypothetical protein
LPNAARLAGTVSVPGNWIGIDGHGFATNDTVLFRAEAGGTLPAPLVDGQEYYAIRLTDGRFQVATAVNGAAVDLTTTGSRVLVIAPLPIASAIVWSSSVIDDMLPAHVVPLALPIPEIVKITAAELACGKLGTFTGAKSATLTELVDSARKRLERWAKGVPVRGVNAPIAPANLAGSATVPHLDARGWARYGGL